MSVNNSVEPRTKIVRHDDFQTSIGEEHEEEEISVALHNIKTRLRIVKMYLAACDVLNRYL